MNPAARSASKESEREPEGLAMRIFIPSLLALAACSPPPPDGTVAKELAALRQGLEDLKKGQQPTFDKEQVLADLTREVRRLRTAPPPAAAPAPEPALVPPTLLSGSLSGGVGGTQTGVNDLYWVLTRIQVEKEERVVLALYQALANGRGFKLAGVRMLGADLQIVEFNQEKPHVKEIVDELKRMKK